VAGTKNRESSKTLAASSTKKYKKMTMEKVSLFSKAYIMSLMTIPSLMSVMLEMALIFGLSMMS
jgi:ferric iron reductase protein FhuF